jgi:hypothetical protein
VSDTLVSGTPLTPHRLAGACAVTALAGIAVTWAWALGIDGKWDEQSRLVVDANYALLAATALAAVVAVVLAVKSRAWRLGVGTALLAIFTLGYVFAALVAIDLSRNFHGFF